MQPHRVVNSSEQKSREFPYVIFHSTQSRYSLRLLLLGASGKLPPEAHEQIAYCAVPLPVKRII
jgi:hypothetical protein